MTEPIDEREYPNTGDPARRPAGDGADALLESAFVAARAEAERAAPVVLLERIEADAWALQPRSRPQPRVGRHHRVREVLAALGGWPALGGLAAAGVTGFWLGFAPPAAVADRGGWLGTEGSEELALVLPDYSLSDLDEG